MLEYFILMKQELALIAMLVVLLVMKVAGKDSAAQVIPLVFVLGILNVCVGWIGNAEGSLFGGMFVNTSLAAFEKNILNGGMVLLFLSKIGRAHV